jgi:hypothetical protein
VEQRADEGLFALAAQQRSLAALARQQAGEIGAQEGLLQFAGIGLVLQVLEQQHGDGDVADGVEAEHDHGARDGADVAAAGLAIEGRIDQPQDLVGQRVVLEDGVGQRADAFAFRGGQLVDGGHRVGQRGEVGLVAHAPQQEFERLLLGDGCLSLGTVGLAFAEPGGERIAQLGGAGIALRRVERAGTQDDAAQLRVDGRPGRRRGQYDRFGGDPVEQILDRAAVEDAPAGKDFEQHQSGAEHVRLRADTLLGDVFGREVGRRPRQLRGFAAGILRGGVDADGDAEIGQSRCAVTGIDEDVRGLEVAVDDALGMGLGEHVGDLAHERDGLDGRQRPVGAQDVGQTAALDPLEDEVGIAVLLAGIEDRHHVGMTETASGARLVEQLGIACGIGMREVQRLDRHLALQLRIPGEIDNALRSPSQFAADLEAPQFAALHGTAGRLFWFLHEFILPSALPIPARAPKICRTMLPDDTARLQVLLTELKVEHHDLDATLARLEESPPSDELLLRRMKKRKLQLKDRIAAVERLLGPDLIA